MANISTANQLGPVTATFTDVLRRNRFVDFVNYLANTAGNDKEGKGIDPRDLYKRYSDFGYAKPGGLTHDLVIISQLGVITFSGNPFSELANYSGNNNFCFIGTIQYDLSK
jgi:hypothetical protein